MLILVWGIGFDKHIINEYIIIFIHLVNNNIKAVIIWETYLVNGFKAKMLVKINIMRSEYIDIIISKK